MEESISKILELGISQGIWAALYIYLFFRMRSASNAFAAAVACKDEGKPVITLRRDGVDFALSYYGEPAGVTGAVLPVEATANAAEPTAHARLSETLHSGMTYSELRPGMDVEIRLTGNGEPAQNFL